MCVCVVLLRILLNFYICYFKTLPEYQAQIAQQQNRQTDTAHTTPAQKMFNAFDVRETSYHFFSQRIDLHLCDDEGGVWNA